MMGMKAGHLLKAFLGHLELGVLNHFTFVKIQ